MPTTFRHDINYTFPALRDVELKQEQEEQVARYLYRQADLMKNVKANHLSDLRKCRLHIKNLIRQNKQILKDYQNSQRRMKQCEEYLENLIKDLL